MPLVLSLVTLQYVDQAALPAAASLLPLAFFLSVLSPQAEETNAIIYLANVGAVSLAARLLTVGLVRRRGE